MRLARRIRGFLRKAAADACREAATIVLSVGGLASAVGVGMIYTPAGVITGGVITMAVGVLIARGES